MSTRKQEQRSALIARLEEALSDLYHNATPNHPMDADGDTYWSWFEDAARYELDYMQGGGPYDRKSLRKWNTQVSIARPTGMLHADYCRPGEYPYVDQPSRNDYWIYACNGRYGKLYQYGRGGRTLAPESWMHRTGYGDEHPKHAEDFEESYASLVELTQIVESFNAYVCQWNDGVADLWHEEQAINADEELHLANRELEAVGYFA